MLTYGMRVLNYWALYVVAYLLFAIAHAGTVRMMTGTNAGAVPFALFLGPVWLVCILVCIVMSVRGIIRYARGHRPDSEEENRQKARRTLWLWGIVNGFAIALGIALGGLLSFAGTLLHQGFL